MNVRGIVRGLIVLTMVAGVVACLRAAEARYTVTDLGAKTQATRINAAGDVVGTIYQAKGEFRAFLFSQGKMQVLGTLGGAFSVTTGLSDDGTVTGSSQTTEPGPNGRPVARPFVYANGVMRELAVTGLEAGVRLGEISNINGSGIMAGLTDERRRRLCVIKEGRATVADTPAEFTRPEFINGLEIKDINSIGQVIGVMDAFQMGQVGPHTSVSTDERRHGFIYTAGQMTDLGDFYPAAINTAGLMVGGHLAADGKKYTVLYDGKTFHELGAPPGFEKGAVAGINAAGLIVGSGETVTGGGFLWIGVNMHAFIYEQGQWKDLNDLVALAGTGLDKLSLAQGINDRGQIICQAMARDGPHAVLLTPVDVVKR